MDFRSGGRIAITIVLAALFSSCQRNPAPKPIQEYQMNGDVVALDEKNHLAIVKHDKIEGWMDAMTMEYPVKDPVQFQKLKVGDKIQAKIDVQGTDYWIAGVLVGTRPAGK